MIKKILNETTVEEVISFEKSQILDICKIIEDFNANFKSLNCNLEYVFYRLDKNGKKIQGEISKSNLVNGYFSYVDIFIKQDGSYLGFDLPDDEGILAINNNTVHITRRLTKVYVTMCDDKSDIIEDLNEYLIDIKRFGVKKIEL